MRLPVIAGITAEATSAVAVALVWGLFSRETLVSSELRDDAVEYPILDEIALLTGDR